jgi:hypothetical protein
MATKTVFASTLPPLGFNGIELSSGAHSRREQGVCAMEAAAWLAGEKHTDSPTCVCPVIAAFVRSWNDALPDADRNRLLKPLIPRLLNTRSTKKVEERRGWLAMDWLIREFAPEWLALVHDLAPHAAALRELPEIANGEAVAVAKPKLSAADSAVYSAARCAVYSAADSAVYSAAYSAVYSAARCAVYSAARCAVYSAADSAVDSAARCAADSAAYSAAYSAADSAADSAAYSAADSAADSAAYSVLAPATAKCQASALQLVERMLGVTA